ncbi:hypothetical protein QO002_002496 [Pararhizobium capsulatum DSM 1112]|uniref:N-acetylmuramoyl-L-alanine amidase domain-containing protein n=1 Tax=Pararhizobium capsulatum DSM 1112 TaxID=1121113 RepID=A0ABU0BQ40_9HYPH|nr:N-acetylmuramoyl-L-alanine amidase [Pararhizobium capsulatum]MDQ0320358.1 hypothetical protein [Pararhizobium capsulatum DSM 1112]
MAYSLIWLPEVLRQAGLKVAETDGWANRGRAEMGRVRGVMCHHTGSSGLGNMPTLGMLKTGRGGQNPLPGPLSQLGLGRDGTYYIVAAGRANHAGGGNWRTLTTGNSSFIGIEAENGGTRADKWPDVQMDVCGRPGKCKQNLSSVRACGRVLTCVRPRKATSTRRGPLWNTWIRSNSLRRARGTHPLTGCSDPVSDRLPIILR